VVASHTGVRGTADNIRNLSDGHVRAIADTGGLIGIGFWPAATGGNDVAAIARAIGHATNVAGFDAVALGSDFDGAVAQPIDATGMVQVTDALLAAGFSDDQVAKVMGGNALRVFADALPDG
jgi:microsomal dipeptidase-like Zn-dependent dipeptidase